jgi:heme-degrading monooxygenase HmoA
MFAVIFIVQPKKDHFDDYLSLAKSLKPDLERVDGFIDNERFGSKRTEGRVLSLSTWRDEKAVIAGGPSASITRSKKRGGSRSSRITTCASARSSPTTKSLEVRNCTNCASMELRLATPRS